MEPPHRPAAEPDWDACFQRRMRFQKLYENAIFTLLPLPAKITGAFLVRRGKVSNRDEWLRLGVSTNCSKMVQMNEEPRSAEFWFQETGLLLAWVDASWACLAGRERGTHGADEGCNQAQPHADLRGELGNSWGPELTSSVQSQESRKLTSLAASDTFHFFFFFLEGF